MSLNYLMDNLKIFTEESDDYRKPIIAIESYFNDLPRIKGSNGRLFIVPDISDDCASENGGIDVRSSAHTAAWEAIVGCVMQGKNDSRSEAVRVACRLLQLQSKLCAPYSTDAFYFPTHMLSVFLNRMLSNETDNERSVTAFKEFTAYEDVLYHCWLTLPGLTPAATPNETYVSNYFNLLDAIALSKDAKKSQPENPDKRMLCETKGVPKFRFNLAKVCKCMEKCWSRVSGWTLQNLQLQRALLILLDHLISRLPHPVLLTDFLMNAMDMGGTVSTLALQGVFTLMQQHNLEYPSVYSKLYSMYGCDLYLSKHKSRLYYLTDIFLSSTHLPEASVAAFVKRFSRLARLFPPADSIVLLHMIANLIVRHPGLGRMIAAVRPSEVGDDPYLPDEIEPSLSGAVDSSLWEVADLKNHVHPGVSAAAAFALSTHRTTLERPISELLDDTDDDLMTAEFDRKYKQVFLATKQPRSIADSTDDRLSNYWQLF